jgi:hypothetical protein
MGVASTDIISLSTPSEARVGVGGVAVDKSPLLSWRIWQPVNATIIISNKME